jgi:FkbM family methyltransferase
MRKIVHAFILAKRHLTGKLKVREISVVKNLIQQDSICLDIGAHGGSWSRPLSQVSKQVYSFEALPYYASVLKILFKILLINNVKVINKAVSDKEGRLSIAWKDASGKRLTGKTHVLGTKEESKFTVDVPSIPLDKFVVEENVQNIDFIKIDVEGAELFVFKGANELIHNFRPIIFCELDERWTSRYDYKPEEVFDFFITKRYCSFIIKNGQTLEKIDKNTYSKRGDVLFVPEEKELGLFK